MVRLRMDSRNTTLAPIIEARQIEKFYTQPDGGRVQVIGITYMLAGATQRSDSDPYDKTSPLLLWARTG
jgi:hypothetical protein